jgi:hypothetical protein
MNKRYEMMNKSKVTHFGRREYALVIDDIRIVLLAANTPVL